MGDFSRMAELPKMYQHCKSEDPDINLLDFVGEHLLNLENILDHFDHDKEDGKKEQPHQPYNFSINAVQPVCTISSPETIPAKPLPLMDHTYLQHNDACIPQSSSQDIFRPPVAV